MNEAQLEVVGDGRFALTGPVAFDNASGVLANGNRLFADNRKIHIDLSKVTHVDSAALAVLLEWLRQTEHAGQSLIFSGMPEKLWAIARLTGTDVILEPQLEQRSATGADSS